MPVVRGMTPPPPHPRHEPNAFGCEQAMFHFQRPRYSITFWVGCFLCHRPSQFLPEAPIRPLTRRTLWQSQAPSQLGVGPTAWECSA